MGPLEGRSLLYQSHCQHIEHNEVVDLINCATSVRGSPRQNLRKLTMNSPAYWHDTSCERFSLL
jgi:hypothetical protein